MNGRRATRINGRGIGSDVLCVFLGMVGLLHAGGVSAEMFVYDAGVIDAGEQVRHRFPIANNSEDALLVLGEYTVSCAACTAVEAYDREIAPGDEGGITICFDSSEKRGRFSIGVSLECDDDARGPLQFSIVGHARGVWIEPPELHFPELEVDETASRYFEVQSCGYPGLEIKSTACTLQDLRIHVDPIDTLDQQDVSRRYRVIAEMTAVASAQGTHEGEVSIDIALGDSSPVKTLLVPVRYTTLGNLRPAAKLLSFGALREGDAVTRECTVAWHGQAPCPDVKDLSVDLGDLRNAKASVGALPPSKGRQGFTLALTAGYDIARQGATYRNSIRLQSSSGDSVDLDVFVMYLRQGVGKAKETQEANRKTP